jgi:hypothetical protein
MEKYITIDEIIELVRLQNFTNQDNLIIALTNCKAGNWKNKAYFQFVSSKNANQVGSEWQFETSIRLEHSTKGTIIIDFLKCGKIGGIEFLNLLE